MAVYQSYVSRFVDQYRQAGQQLAEKASATDRTGAAALAHKMKGAAYSLALTTVAEQCLAVESALKRGDAIADPVAALQLALDEVAESLSAWPVAAV
jgi:HPt (histidine-containing phosphotransfer) domain-containing protein